MDSHPIAVYFESWFAKWTNSPETSDLAKISKPITMVYLSFAKPDCGYKKGSMKWDGTGLNFNCSFDMVKKSVEILKNKKIIVMLSVGGGSYWHGTVPFHSQNCVDLMNDLGCDGIDIDWEGHAEKDYELTDAIKSLKPLMGTKKISFAGFSTGAYGKDGDTYKGSAIDAMTKQGSNVDWINIMAYDAGKNFNPLGAFAAYQVYFKGPLLMGFQPGKQGWGDAMLTIPEVQRNCEIVKAHDNKHGVFVWAYYKKSENECTVQEVISSASKIFSMSSPPPVKPEPPKKKFKAVLTCPKCDKDVTITIS